MAHDPVTPPEVENELHRRDYRKILEMPDVHIPDPRKRHEPPVIIPDIPDVHVPEIPDVHVPEIPDVHVPEIPEVHVPEPVFPDFPRERHMPEIPEFPRVRIRGCPWWFWAGYAAFCLSVKEHQIWIWR